MGFFKDGVKDCTSEMPNVLILKFSEMLDSTIVHQRRSGVREIWYSYLNGYIVKFVTVILTRLEGVALRMV